MGDRVVFVLPTLGRGGSERQVAGLAVGLLARGCAVRVICAREGGAWAEGLRARGVEVEVLRCRGKLLLGLLPRLLARLRARPAEVVYAWLGGLEALALIPAWLAGVERRLAARRELSGWMRRRHRIAQAIGAAFSTRILCVSRAVREDCLRHERVEPQRFAVAPNGVDAERFAAPAARAAWRARLEVDDGQLVALTVANFEREKGHAVLLEAASAVLARFPELRFVWAGDGPLRPPLERAAAQRGLGDRMRFPGQVEQVEGLYAAADLYLHPSISEGSPNALLEAMAAGLGCVASAAGGTPELLEHGREGLLVAPGDPAALAAAACELLGDPARRQRLGQAAQRRARGEHEGAAARRRHLDLVLAR